MVIASAGAALALALALTSAAPARASDVVVATAGGRLAGGGEGGVVAFRGVPYAAPPVGARRWAAPAPFPAWADVRAARTFGAQCPQLPNPNDAGIGAQPFSEDCLTLNVWTPRLGAAARAPVMVWLHGGGFVNGSGSAPLYDGAALARRGVVLVTVNYRLGRLGFFAHPALTAAGGPLANYALMDQIAALRWVRRNARAFGGDPDNVTLFGESAGGWAVNQLMLAPSARGLFQRAIVQSGLGREQPTPLAQAEREGEAFVAGLGARAASLAELRDLPADRLVSPAPSIYQGFGPIRDGLLVRGGVAEGFAAGRQARIPYLVGFNGLEFPGERATDMLRARLPTLMPGERARALEAYGDEAAFRRAFLSDVLFVEPSVTLAAAQARHGAPTYLYRFDAAPRAVHASVGGAFHASERAYVFGNLDHAAWPTGAEDRALSEAMMSAWTSFAARGAPAGPSSTAWPAVDPTAPAFEEFTTAGARVRPAAALAGYLFTRDLQAARR